MEGMYIYFSNRRYIEYNVILFMDWDADIAATCRADPDVRIGIIDPRLCFDGS